MKISSNSMKISRMEITIGMDRTTTHAAGGTSNANIMLRSIKACTKIKTVNSNKEEEEVIIIIIIK